MAAGLLPLQPVDREPLLWLAPTPLWEHEDSGVAPGDPAFERPWLVELATDDFIPAFLALTAGDDPAGPTGMAALAPADGSGVESDPSVLYRPLHQRFYLVVGSLVCRRIGLPDRTVGRGQRLSFVVRRLGASGEQAWLPAKRSWVAVTDALALVAGEEQHPMHTAPIGVATATGPAAVLLGLDEAGRRQVHFGYVPVAGPSAMAQPLADPLQALADDEDKAVADDARILEFRLRVAGAWSDVGAKALLADIHEPSLYVLLDLRDWLAKYLPSVLDALVADTTLPNGTPREAVRAHLDINVLADNVARRLGTVLGELEDYLPLLAGAAIAEPAAQYDVSSPPGGLPAFVDTLGGTGATSGGLLAAALDDPVSPAGAQRVPPELEGAIVARPDDPAALADRHVLRLVYEHDPCAPVVSKPSAVVRFAGVYDPDAPARPIRIELPDPNHLRRFTRGVAIDMPPSLRRILDAVTPKILKGDPLGPEGGWELGMICSFSLQIIMLVAFIVMFIFLILLNIVFWWLPFLRICFPVPKKRSASP